MFFKILNMPAPSVEKDNNLLDVDLVKYKRDLKG